MSMLQALAMVLAVADWASDYIDLDYDCFVRSRPCYQARCSYPTTARRYIGGRVFRGPGGQKYYREFLTRYDKGKMMIGRLKGKPWHGAHVVKKKSGRGRLRPFQQNFIDRMINGEAKSLTLQAPRGVGKAEFGPKFLIRGAANYRFGESATPIVE